MLMQTGIKKNKKCNFYLFSILYSKLFILRKNCVTTWRVTVLPAFNVMIREEKYVERKERSNEGVLALP